MAIESAGATSRIDTPRRPAAEAPCHPVDQLAGLLIMLAALSAMAAGWFGTLGSADNRRPSPAAHAVLMIIGFAGTIAATRLLESMTIR